MKPTHPGDEEREWWDDWPDPWRYILGAIALALASGVLVWSFK